MTRAELGACLISLGIYTMYLDICNIDINWIPGIFTLLVGVGLLVMK
jgi:hypothetical protein